MLIINSTELGWKSAKLSCNVSIRCSGRSSCHADRRRWILSCSFIWQVDCNDKIKVTSEINSRAFKRFFGRGAGLTFEARLALIEQGTGGRVIHRMPADANDDWYDEQGVAQPRPQPPANLAHLNTLLMEVQLNSSRVYCTSHRFVCFPLPSIIEFISHP